MINSEFGRALTKNNAYFANPKGRSLVTRLDNYNEWISERHLCGVWPYSRQLCTSPQPEAEIAYLGHPPRKGINLAVQDYLSLSTHPAIQEVATFTIREFGVHSAGSAMLLGNSWLSSRLERAISQLLDLEHVLLFPTGWAAGYGTIKGLIRENDHVVLDALAHACLQEGASCATENIYKFKHLNNNDAEQHLKNIREKDEDNAILVVTEGLFSMDSDSPNIKELQDICRKYDASLLLDVAHDLGALGQNGTGSLGIQKMIGQVDFVMGAFSKTFASNGGFLASNHYAVKQYLKWFANPFTFSNAMSPIQCAVVAKAFEIIQTQEGKLLRERLFDVATTFRAHLTERGLTILGAPSAIVPVLVGRESVARIASKEVSQRGVFTNLIEFPAVGLGAARFRCQLMANHEHAHVEEAAWAIHASINCAQEAVSGLVSRAGELEAAGESQVE
jgi:glycine C-acetyltransferase